MDWSNLKFGLPTTALLAVLMAFAHASDLAAQSAATQGPSQSPRIAPLTVSNPAPIFGLPNRDRTADFAGREAPSAIADGLRGMAAADTASGAQSDQLTDYNRSAVPNDTDISPDEESTAANGRTSDGDTPSSANDTLQSLDPDQRSQRDSDAFTRPFAGHNPEAFQIESINPLLDRRTRRLFRR